MRTKNGRFLAARRLVIVLLVLLYTMTPSIIAAIAAPMELYVAGDGNDAWSGRLSSPNAIQTDGPCATLTKARDEIRALRAAGRLPDGATVLAREGTYHLDETFALGPEDGGSEQAPVVYRNYGAEHVRLVGGHQLTGFRPYKGEILQCDLKSLGLANIPFRQLFFKGKRQILARWPNLDPDDIRGGEWTYISFVPEQGSTKKFGYFGDRPNRGAHPEDCQVSIWPNYNWWQTIVDVAAIDRDESIITLAKEMPYTIEPGRRYFYQNLFEELDAPGEWYADRRTGILYFWPPEPIDAGDVIVPTTDTVVKMSGASHVTVRGLTIECCRGDGVVIENGTACIVAGNTVRNTGGYGIVIGGGRDTGAVGNDIHWTGRGGISLSGGDRKTLTPAGNYALNNHIHHFANLYKTYQTGVNISGVGNRIAHNLIHDAPHIAILLGGNEHVLEFNEIHHVCLEGADNGGFYMGRDWTQRGNIIRYNKFHDIYGYGLANQEPNKHGIYYYDSPHWAWGVYLDDCSSGTIVYGNVFYRVPLCGVMIGGGRDNLIENNIFVDCIPALHTDARWDAYCWDVMQERLEAMNYTEPPYSTRYPELLDMNDPRCPAGNTFLRNVMYYEPDDFAGITSTRRRNGAAIIYNLAPFDPETSQFDWNTIYHFGLPVRIRATSYGKTDGKTLLWDEWRERGFDAHSIIADPLFIAPQQDNFQLRDDSPAYKQGYKRIPIEKIGLYRDELRASWPIPPDTRRDGMEYTREAVKVPPLTARPENVCSDQ